MQAAYFFSGFDKEAGFGEEIARHLREDIEQPRTLLYIASTPAAHDKNAYYQDICTGWFAKAGMVFEETMLLDDRIDAATGQRWILEASCIFLSGGDTLAQFAYLQQNGYADVLRTTQTVIAGMSAGAINMGRLSMCLPYGPHTDTVLYEGLGIADMTIEPHFSPDNLQTLHTLRQIARKHPVHGLSDGAAILVHGAYATFLGDVYRITPLPKEEA